jgi:hydroxymethylpyrimidine pyrophosphatase-like HAD family hydrolase
MKISKKIKAVIMDGDGSTITHQNELPDSLRDLILNNPHIKWIMATGRSLDLLHKTPIARYLSDDVPHIVDGGSRLMYLDGVSKTSKFISKDELKLFHSSINSEDINFIYYSPDGINGFCYSVDQAIREDIKFNGNNVRFTQKREEFENWTFRFLPTKIFVNIKRNVSLDGLYYNINENNVDITARGVNKGSACVELLNILGLDQSEVAFVFNDKNDLPIVEHTNLSKLIKIKVGDALPEILSDFYVASPHHVAAVVQQLL